MRALHTRRAKFVLRSGLKNTLSLRSEPPALYILLSTLLPSKNRSSRTGKPWAKDLLKVKFQGIETTEPKNPTASDVNLSQPSPSLQGTLRGTASSVPKMMHPESEEDAIMIAEGHLETAIPAGLLVKQHLDKDIAFHPSTSAFAFRLRARVGEPTLAPLIERLQRVERLVDFVQVINAHPNALHCESVSLSRLIFSYGYKQSPTSNQSLTESPRYQTIIDFSSTSPQLELQLEAGNPHIRILDHLTKILNSSLGLHGLATILPLTLPILRAFDAAENAWSALSTYGELQIFSRATDWYTIRYLLTPPSSNNDTGDTKTTTAPDMIVFKLKLQRRGNIPWWYIRRDRKYDTSSLDQLDLTLQKTVWAGGENGVWTGMQCAAIAQIDGAEAMVSRVDAAMRDIATDRSALAGIGLGVMGVDGLEDGSGQNNSGELKGQGIGQTQVQVQQSTNAPNKSQEQRPQTKSPVMQKQKPRPNQGQPQNQQKAQALLVQQLARQKEAQRQAQVRQGQRQNQNPGNGHSGKQDTIVID